jgi:hypothetical protein
MPSEAGLVVVECTLIPSNDKVIKSRKRGVAHGTHIREISN